VKGHSRSFELVPFEGLDAISYSPSIVTTVSILHHLRDKATYWSKIVICSHPLHSTPQWGGSPSEYCHPVWFGTQYRRVTDGQMDGRTSCHP